MLGVIDADETPLLASEVALFDAGGTSVTAAASELGSAELGLTRSVGAGSDSVVAGAVVAGSLVAGGLGAGGVVIGAVVTGAVVLGVVVLGTGVTGAVVAGTVGLGVLAGVVVAGAVWLGVLAGVGVVGLAVGLLLAAPVLGFVVDLSPASFSASALARSSAVAKAAMVKYVEELLTAPGVWRMVPTEGFSALIIFPLPM